MAEIPEKLLVNIEVTQRKVEKQLAAIAKKASAQAKGIEDDFMKANKGVVKSFGSSSFAAGNLAAQLNDIGVGLASGQSPFTVMIQQGSQVSQVLNQAGGSAAALKTIMVGAFSQMLNPVSLATFAIIGLGGAALHYFTSTAEKTKEADKALEEHAAIIKDIKAAYGDAAKGLDEYISQSADVLTARARGNLEVLQAQLRAKSQDILQNDDVFSRPLSAVQNLDELVLKRRQLAAEGKDLTEINRQIAASMDGEGQAVLTASSKYSAFKTAIDAFVASVNAGTPDVEAFRTSVATFMNANPNDRRIQDLGQSLLELSEDAGKTARLLPSASAAISTIGGAAAGQIDDVRKLTAALHELASIAMPALSPREGAEQARIQGMKQANDAITRAAVQKAYDDAIARIDSHEMPDGGAIPTPTKKPSLLDYDPNKTSKSSGGGGSKTNPYQSGVQSIKDRTAALQAENQALAGINPLEKDYGAAVTKARITQQLLNDAQRAHLAITPELRASIDALAAGYTNASVESRKLAESQREAQRSAEEFRQLGKDVLGGFINDLASGKSAADALSGALGKIADKLLDIALNNIFDGSGGGGGGLLSGIGKVFGFANGGVMTPMGPRQLKRFASGGVSHQAAIFGEAGPEAAVPLPDGRSIPVTIKGSRAASGGVVYADHRTITIDARGAQQGVGAEIRKALSEYDSKTLPVRVKQIQQDPRMRG